MSLNHTIILYAEDDEDDRIFMREAVDEMNSDYLLIMVEDGVHAIEKLKDLDEKKMLPCIIAIDGNMPIMNGRDTVVEIRNNKDWDNIPLCIFSTSSAQWFADVAEKYDVKVYRKPTTVAAYKHIVADMLNHCR